MQFRRSGQRDDRRRRVLSDTLWHESATVRTDRGTSQRFGSGGPPVRKSRNYGDAVFMDEQPRLTDLIPTRLPTLAVMMLAGVTVIVALEVFYTWMPLLAPMTTDGRVAAIDLDGEGSLAVWFSSMTLAAAGLVAIVVYRVRQHRTDDYHGHYRIWLWAAMCWFLLSLDETASLHEGFKEMMAHLTGTRLLGDGSMWWVIVYGFLLGGVGTRLLVDMRECLASAATFVAVAFCYALAVTAQLGWVLPDSGARGVMLEEGAEMVGNLLLLLSMVLHARHVIFDAEGLLPEQQPRQTKPQPRSRGLALTSPDDDAEADELEERRLEAFDHPVVVHPPHGLQRPLATPAAAKPAVEREPARPAAAPATPEAPVSRKLTKAERKALRNRLRQMAVERQRREKAG